MYTSAWTLYISSPSTSRKEDSADPNIEQTNSSETTEKKIDSDQLKFDSVLIAVTNESGSTVKVDV